MRTAPFVLIFSVLVLSFSGCEKGKTSIGGSQSAIGEVGVTVETAGTSGFGVSNAIAEVVALEKGVSEYSGSATVTNAAIKNMLSNAPGVTISGNTVTVTGVKMKVTTDGIESVEGFHPGVIVDYNAKVGDTYPMKGNNRSRKVVSRSTDDDYFWGGWMLIKVIEVEEPTNSMGIARTTYWANHRWGMVGIEFELDDGTILDFPIYNSANN
jgi:hypothetical protein